jgi:hypothetical protein
VNGHPIVDLFGASVGFQLAERLQDDGPLSRYAQTALAGTVYESLQIVHLLLYLQIFASRL